MRTWCCSTSTSWGTGAPSSIPSSPAAWSGSSSTASRSCGNGITTRRRRPGGHSAHGASRRRTMARNAWTLKGGTIVDGSGGPGYVGDVVIEEDRIASVGPAASSGTVIDVAGLVVAPGFVDIHSHDDWLAPLPDGPALLGPNVQQGITTTVA